MQISPSREEFIDRAPDGRAGVVWATLVADLETPVSAFLKLGGDAPNSFLLESVEGGAVLGRYSFIGLRPDILWRCTGNAAEINRDALADTDAFTLCDAPPLDALRALLAESAIDLPDELPPSSVGLFGYMGYDTVRLVEDIPDGNPETLGIPDGIMMRPTVMLVFDNIRHTVTVITPVWSGGADGYDAACDLIRDTLAKLKKPVPETDAAPMGWDDTIAPESTSNTTRDEYHAMVEKAREYICAGDIFQVVPSQRFSLPFTLPPFALYRALRRLNPSPFLFYLNFGAFSLVGSSPEILVRVRDGTVTIRPIAGTRKRGATPEEDKALAEDLLGDPKERAEHLMLLDLGRNDVGRVAEIGSVRVTEQYTIEYYSHVMHIVSNVEGALRDDLDGLDALFAGFPAGTVSGAPKIRAMEIIDELEKTKRGFYAGCVGYLGADGSVDSCIALRTALVKDGMMHVQAGGGVVADSDAEAEYQESCNKARALFAAAKEAARIAAQDSA